MAKLAVVPGNTVDDLIEKGLSARLQGYYNPRSFFEQVFCLSPFENSERDAFGMRVIPTKDVELPRRLRELGVDVVRAYGGNTPAEIAVFYRSPGVPVIVSLHDKRPEMIRPAVCFADAVFVVSEELRGIALARGVKAERIFLVPNGVDTALMRPLPLQDLGDLPIRFPFKRKLLHVGRKSPEKNIGAIIRSLARLGPDYGLVSVGQGDPEPYLALAYEAGVADRCAFLPGVPQAELVKFYNWADCICHPSRSEAMCNVLLEALACGAAVVATETSAAGLGDGLAEAMLLVRDPEDDIGFAGEIRRACEDREVSQRLRERARRSVEHLSLDRGQAHEVDCYQRVLAMNARGDFRRGLADAVCQSWANGERRLRRRLWRRP